MASKEWWDSLSHTQQLDYLKQHKTSKLKPTKTSARKNYGGVKAAIALQADKAPVRKKYGGVKAAIALDKNYRPPVKRAHSVVPSVKRTKTPEYDRPKPAVLNKAVHFIKNNADKIALALGPTLGNMHSKYDESIDKGNKKDNRSLLAAINTASTLKNSRALGIASQALGGRTGVALIALTGLALVTGIDLSLVIVLLNSDFFNSASNFVRENADSDDDYVRRVGHRYIDHTEQALRDPKQLQRSIVQHPGDVIIDDELGNETAALTFNYNHETDLNKALTRLERLDVAAIGESIVNATEANSVRINRLLTHTYLLETGIPKITSVLVAAVTRKNSLSVRAQTQLVNFHSELRRCRQELAALATQKAAKSSLLTQLLRKHLVTAEYSFERTFVRSEDNQIRGCEVHRFNQLELAGNLLGNIEIFGYYDAGELHLACTRDALFLPKAFEHTKPRHLRQWLQTQGLC